VEDAWRTRVVVAASSLRQFGYVEFRFEKSDDVLGW